VKLIIQPDDGLTPIMQAVKRAKKTIDLTIFRFDRPELEKALQAAVARGVVVRALIAHTNRGGEKGLRKLELRLLEMGVTVSRTADDLPRYHGKMALVDDALLVLGFNFTQLDIEKSRSFGILTRNPALYKEAVTLYEADCTRQPFIPTHKSFVVSPDRSRALLTAFIKGAKKQLLIYDEKITDRLILRELNARAEAGVEIRVLGKMDKAPKSAEVRKLSDLRPHVRAIIRDGVQAFVGSQSLRKLELDNRREIGLIVNDSRIARKIQAVFEEDWAHAAGKGDGKNDKDKDNDKGKGKDKEKDKDATKVA
jgi:phosphatidylserine/phosphatidylglycerophosphate/cardiolipin synthase-like enzyme